MCVFMSSPQSFFNLEILCHEFGDDLVLLTDFGFELVELLGLGRRFRTTRAIEDHGRILEELRLPAVETAGLDLVLITDFGDRLSLD